jgi:hypothetical protein
MDDMDESPMGYASPPPSSCGSPLLSPTPMVPAAWLAEVSGQRLGSEASVIESHKGIKRNVGVLACLEWRCAAVCVHR